MKEYAERLKLYCENVAHTIAECDEAIRHAKAEIEIANKQLDNWTVYAELHRKEYERATGELKKLLDNNG